MSMCDKKNKENKCLQDSSCLDVSDNNKQHTTYIDVFSCGIEPMPSLEAMDFSIYDAVFGSASLLKSYVHGHAQTFPIGAHAHDDACKALSLAQGEKKVAVLCSGDALYHGFGASLAKEARKLHCSKLIKFHPHVTAFQSLFHKLGIEWHDVQLFSAHHGIDLPLRKIVSCNMPLIYGGTKYPAHLLAQEIINFVPSYADKRGVMAEFLGSYPTGDSNVDGADNSKDTIGKTQDNKKERILRGTLRELAKETFSPTSILLILPPHMQGCMAKHRQEKVEEKELSDNYLRTQIIPLGLPEYVFAKENNLITASDARAIILSRLRLPLKGVLWDLGAGSGSVGLEAAALSPSLDVHSVEQNKDRVVLIETNKKALGLINYTVHQSKIIDALLGDEIDAMPDNSGKQSGGQMGNQVGDTTETLKKPSRIFIGGGGKGLPEIMDICAQKLDSQGILVASAVTLESFHALYSWEEKHALKRTGCLRLNMAYESVIAGTYHHFKDQNTLYIFTYSKD